MSNSSMLPSAMDLLLVLPRLARRAGSFALVHVPEAVDNIAGKMRSGGSAIADATSSQTSANSTITNTSNIFVQSTAAALRTALEKTMRGGEIETEPSSFYMGFAQSIARLKDFGGIFSYLTSHWAWTTFAVAILLNRAQFYASSREHLQFKWHVRLGIYAIPIAALVMQTIAVLQAMRCQTSPDYALLRYGEPNKRYTNDFTTDGGFLYQLSSNILFWQDDAACCTARSMALSGAEDGRSKFRGSASLLFYVFITLCTSQWFETLSCALQGRQVVPETGMTIFEHSLAFAEVEAMLSAAVGLDFFGHGKADSASAGIQAASVLTRQDILSKLNVPPQVLLVCLISCFSHLSSAILAVTNLRHKVRLLNTALWAICYMSALIWSLAKFLTTTIEDLTDPVIPQFPTVSIVGFIPHMLFVVGIMVCAIIYGLAIVVTAFSVPQDVADGLTVFQRLNWAYQNLQANVQFSQNSAIRIRMSEDFYTALLKVGFNVLTAASEAVYLNEGCRIQVAKMTWIEQKRIDDEAARIEHRKRGTAASELLGEGIAPGLGFEDTQNLAIGQSPYARERKSRSTRNDGEKAGPPENDTGLGLAQRRRSMQLTFEFVAGLFWLIVRPLASAMLGILQGVGIHRRPFWLLKAAGMDGTRRKTPMQPQPVRASTQLDFYMIGVDGHPTLPSDNNVDVEAEMRQRQQHAGTYKDEESLSDSIYKWWRQNGFFGDIDTSGDFQDMARDDDTTSILSTSSSMGSASADEDFGDADSGQKTPTQQEPFSQETTPRADYGLDFASLSRLLDPQTSADRDEARILSHSLQSNRPLTRGQYRRNRTELLSGLRSRTSARLHSTEGEEERGLEQFILSQRSNADAKVRRVGGGTWESGAEGMGADGPQCVVCQSSPRTILVWPCGCLSMCDECRVGLAVRNYTKCICCRTDIAAYSRLYVP